MSWYWNEIEDKDSARYATTTAVWISYWIAAGNGLIAVLSLVYHKPVVGLNGWSLLDAVVFWVVGWGIAHLSRVWAVVGFSLYLLEITGRMADQERVGFHGIGILAILFLIVYLNALRGTFAYHKYVKL